VNRKKELSGPEAFDAYYSVLFGNRWPALRSSLLSPPRAVPWQEALLKPYFLDAGSVEAALALPLDGAQTVLDMCAAPGGKTLVLAGRLADGAVLTANEFSRDRKARLLSVLDQHLPESLRTQVRVTGRDASRWSRYEQSAYDRILLDAPCSSERHVLSAPSFLAGWTAARIRNLALRQWSLLSGAWLVLRPGGYLLYSTCALAPEENDLVIGRLLKKYHGVCIEETGRSDSLGEKTVYGRHVLPDTASGAGPLYYALVRKDELEV
jgi:tRNA and rRNA cytosine-C5-methylases